MFHRLLLAAVVAGLVAPSAAKADFTLSLASGGETATVNLLTGAVKYAGGANGLFDPVIVFPGSGIVDATLNGYTITAVFAQTNAPGSQTGAILNLTGVNVIRNSSTAANGTLSIELTATNYTSPTPQATLSTTYSAAFANNVVFVNAAIKTQLPTVTESSYYDNTNTAFGMGGQGTSVASTSPGSGIALVTHSTGLPSTSGMFSMTDVLSLSGMGTGFSNELTSGSISATVYAPAPTGLILAVTMVPFFGLLRRRLRGMAKPVA